MIDNGTYSDWQALFLLDGQVVNFKERVKDIFTKQPRPNPKTGKVELPVDQGLALLAGRYG